MEITPLNIVLLAVGGWYAVETLRAVGEGLWIILNSVQRVPMGPGDSNESRSPT
jgi:hypothetical protein